MKRLALVLALACLVLAGCGGSGRLSKSAYQQRVQADGKVVEQTVVSLTKQPPKTITALAARLDAAEAAVKKAADDLAAAKPPSDAVADNAAIVAGLRAIQAGLEKVKANPTAAGIIVAEIASSPRLKAAEKAIADLKRKGYDIGAIGVP